ncbi:MAG: CoB--CoM heterodisulfide reductase iron-sulfur subunit B family protein [Desulfatirhabdiaceae bacterium]
MKYLYYPGCSLDGTAREYNESTRNLMKRLDVELIELTDWTCCGASAAEFESRLLSLALPARNLAIAEKMADGLDLLVPCSACYLNLKKVVETVKTDPLMLSTLNQVLAEDGLKLAGRIHVRHLLDILSVDIGPQAIQDRVIDSLSGLSVAPYYGCQCLRPYAVFDDPELPTSMNALIQATGAQLHVWEMGAKCCGASHMNTHHDAGLTLVEAILSAARPADAVVTVCPMCQMNLEGYQHRISAMNHADLHMPILYLPQLLGMALGISRKELQIDQNLTSVGRLYMKMGSGIVP